MLIIPTMRFTINLNGKPRLTGFVFVALMLATTSHLASAESEWTVLFDGKSLAGWRGYKMDAVPESWKVEEGQIKGTGEGPDLVTEATYSNFELTFEWKLSEGGNSGVLYLVSESGEAAFHSGPEYQLLDDEHYQQDLSPVHSAAAIYGLYGTKHKTLNRAGEYNSAKIIVRGSRIEHWLNGELVNQCDRNSEDWKTKLAASKFHAWASFANGQAGHIALQAHGSDVWFRNLQIKRLEAPQPASTTDSESNQPSDETRRAPAAGTPSKPASPNSGAARTDDVSARGSSADAVS